MLSAAQAAVGDEQHASKHQVAVNVRRVATRVIIGGPQVAVTGIVSPSPKRPNERNSVRPVYALEDSAFFLHFPLRVLCLVRRYRLPQACSPFPSSGARERHPSRRMPGSTRPTLPVPTLCTWKHVIM